ncbi:MAG: alpha-glucosidase [Alphaproteobacteria bacterium]
MSQDWWRGAVIYQIYPRSFYDADGDGTGDLPGILQRLDYVAALGVDAVWISPFFKSPQKDYGYDVADYFDVDPLFGTLADADQIIAAAHARGLKVLVDLVLSHTSDQHPWFRESRQDRGNPKADWYVWADPAPDGTPPNNWLSIFGGVAWEYEPRRRQYYLHNFLKEQPDLNLHQPAVVAALLEIARFWLERGVDGFRLDAIDFAVHDPALRDNPVRSREQGVSGGLVADVPYTFQWHAYDKGLAELLPVLLEPLRALANRYGDVALLGELSGDRALENAARYTAGGRGLHMAYTFDLLAAPYTATAIGGIVDALEAMIDDGWPCWSFSNHDVTRAPTRFGGDDPPEGLRRQLPVLLTCLRGTACLYQGEELGLEEAALVFDDIRDPYGRTMWPVYKGRDGARTPMPWCAEAPAGGFTAGEPWLPVPAAHRARAVDRQSKDANATLAVTRRFLAWRRGQPALRVGGWRRLEAAEPVLAFVREAAAGDRLVCVFNLAAAATSWRPPMALVATDAPVPAPATIEATRVELPPYGVLIARPLEGES